MCHLWLLAYFFPLISLKKPRSSSWNSKSKTDKLEKVAKVDGLDCKLTKVQLFYLGGNLKFTKGEEFKIFATQSFTSSSTCLMIEEKLNQKFCGWKAHFEYQSGKNHYRLKSKPKLSWKLPVKKSFSGYLIFYLM